MREDYIDKLENINEELYRIENELRAYLSKFSRNQDDNDQLLFLTEENTKHIFEPNNKVVLGNLINTLMEEKNFKRNELAEDVGVSPKTISRILNGEDQLHELDTILKICVSLKCSKKTAMKIIGLAGYNPNEDGLKRVQLIIFALENKEYNRFNIDDIFYNRNQKALFSTI
jgi:DNA-binding Xre family transcriptional regulator